MGWFNSVFSRGDEDAAITAIDASITGDVPPDLAAIAEQTNVGAERLAELAHVAAVQNIHRNTSDGLAAGAVPTQAIYEQGIAFGLSTSDAKSAIESAVSDHFTKLVVDILEDGQVNPEEDQRIADFGAMIGQSVLSQNTEELLNAGRRLHQACNAPLLHVDAPVLLRGGEFCVSVIIAEACEDRSRTVRVGYHGPSLRIPLGHGLSYRVGSVQAVRQTEMYQHSFGQGTLCMTNKRFLWIGPHKSISVLLSNIARFEPYVDGIMLFKGTGRPVLFRWPEDRVACIIAQRTINELRG